MVPFSNAVKYRSMAACLALIWACSAVASACRSARAFLAAGAGDGVGDEGRGLGVEVGEGAEDGGVGVVGGQAGGVAAVGAVAGAGEAGVVAVGAAAAGGGGAELATNAVTHTASRGGLFAVEVEVACYAQAVRVTVADQGAPKGPGRSERSARLADLTRAVGATVYLWHRRISLTQQPAVR
jgi:hypothetical protein